MEFVGAQRRAYAQLKSKAKKTALINSMCQAFGFDRKYANKLLTGNRRYKDPKGRGRTYSDHSVQADAIWSRSSSLSTRTSPKRPLTIDPFVRLRRSRRDQRIDHGSGDQGP